MNEFKEHIYLFAYEGEIRNIMLKYKFNDKSYIYHTFVEFLKNISRICVQIKKYDIIMPVPISKIRYKERGYNQSAIFSKGIAKELNIKYYDTILKKIKHNYMQSLLKQEERENNVKDAYAINTKTSRLIKDKNILLVDDIFTTGSTVNECSRILNLEGAKSVGIFTIAKD